jgi:hypothetical protein
MMRHFELTIVAFVANTVDLTHYPLASKMGIGTLLDDAHEFMAGNALESHVALDDLQVGVAYARRQYAHEGLAR